VEASRGVTKQSKTSPERKEFLAEIIDIGQHLADHQNN